MIRVFKRSATNFREFFRARKITVAHVSTPEEAIEMCDEFNDNRSPRQVQRGTKMEWEKA